LIRSSTSGGGSGNGNDFSGLAAQAKTANYKATYTTDGDSEITIAQDGEGKSSFLNGNSLIITDYAENLRRIEKVVASLDQAPAGEPMIVTLRHASAIDLVPLVNRLLGAPPERVRIDVGFEIVQREST